MSYSTTFQFVKCCEIEAMGTCEGIEIPITRHPDEDKHFKTLHFEEALPVSEAVTKAEAFLSIPLTKEYYLMVQAFEDWWYTEPFETYDGKPRGKLLGDLQFLEDVRVNKDGVAILDLGS